MKQNSLNFLGSKYDLENMKNDISLNITSAYMQVLFSQELLQVADNQLDITSQQMEQTSKMVDAGMLPEGSLLEIQAQYFNDELGLVNAQNQLDLAYLSLKQLMNLEGKNDFQIAQPSIDIPSEEVLSAQPNQVFQTAVDNQPVIKSAETSVMSAEKGLSIARGTASPSITVTRPTPMAYGRAVGTCRAAQSVLITLQNRCAVWVAANIV